MTPKEKAIELVNKFSPLVMTWDYSNDDIREDECILIDAKKCALIAVDEVIKYAQRWGDLAQDDIKEFEQVKKELNEL